MIGGAGAGIGGAAGGGSSGGGMGGASSLMGDTKASSDIGPALSQLSALRSQLQSPQLPQVQTQDQSTVRSTVTNPTLDQLIDHFGVGPQKAQGEIGDLLNKGGY